MTTQFRSTFTPSMMTGDVLESLFVQRQGLVRHLVGEIREGVLRGNPHHVLIVGPRGIGKTHLVSLAYHRLRRSSTELAVVVAWMREEEWGITSVLDLFLRILRAVLAENDDPALRVRAESLYGLRPEKAEPAARSLLAESLKGRRLVLILENVDALFANLKMPMQRRLRQLLEENSGWTLLATAPSLFNSVSRRSYPFFGFFAIEKLDELSLPDATALLTKIAVLEGNTELSAFLSTSEGQSRLQAVYALAGGNHRVLAIFSHFLTKQALEELVGPFLRTLDDLTPYYQSRIGTLSPQKRKIVETICESRGAVAVREIAKRCFMSQQTASSQLKTLREEGHVRARRLGRDSFYELREPLMRLCVEVKANRAEPIRLLVRFLRVWYSRQELHRWLTSLHADAVLEREYLQTALEVGDETDADVDVLALVDEFEHAMRDREYERALPVARKLVDLRQDGSSLDRLAHCLSHLGRWAEVREHASRALELNSGDTTALYSLWRASYRMASYEEALEFADRLVLHYPRKGRAHCFRASTLARLDREREAVEALDRAVEVAAKDAVVWSRRGHLLRDLGKHTDAIYALSEASRLDPRDPTRWVDLGRALADSGKYSDALDAFDKATKCDSSYEPGWHDRGYVLCNLGRYAEAAESYRLAIAIGGGCVKAEADLAETLLMFDWEHGKQVFESTCKKLGESAEKYVANTRFVLRRLLEQAHVSTTVLARVRELIELYRGVGLLGSLSQSLVMTIRDLVAGTVSHEIAERWRDVWKAEAGNEPVLSVSIRLLDAAVRYSGNGNPRILLELPVEERTLLTGLIGSEIALLEDGKQ